MENEISAWRQGTPSISLGTRRRFTEEQRQAGVALATRAIAAGIGRMEVCRRMGISECTLRQWETRRRKLIPVHVVAAPVEEPVRVFIGRVEAQLSVAQLVELARGLM